MEQKMNHGQQLIKENNEKTLFRLVREHKALSRADLKRLTGLSPTTVSSLADDLIAKGLFIETGIKEVKSSGRKATLLEIKPDGGHFITAHVGRKVTTVECFDLEFKVVRHYETETVALPELAEKIKNAIVSFDSKYESDTVAIVVGFSGIVKRGRILSSSIVNVEGADVFAEKLKSLADSRGIPYYLLNDSCLSAYAETVRDRDLKDIIAIDIDQGVGAGILFKGHIFTGADGAAGELGHTTVDCNGELCSCGNRGCLELSVSVPAMIEACRAIDPSVESFLDVTLATDRFAPVILSVAERLSFGLVNIINLFDPQKVVISGPLTRLGDAFLEPLVEKTREKLMSSTVVIEYSSIVGNLVTIGGAKFAFDHILI